MAHELAKELTGHDARSIANFILSAFDAKQFEISNKKINKLIYFAHGYHFARFNSALIRNYFEAWEHGPVVRVVYESFKQFGFDPIAELAFHFDLFEQIERLVTFDDLSLREQEFILRITSHYVQYSADELERMTHQPGTPWAITRCKQIDEPQYQNRIMNNLIRDYFAAEIGELSRLH
jgi:uncharacterized phage-associated protein